MKSRIRNKTGITLIALVITIIVLLILAGVSITMISSQDGILNKATGAKQTQKKASDEEAVKLALQATMMNENGTVDLSKVEGIEGYEKENATIEKDGKTYAE